MSGLHLIADHICKRPHTFHGKQAGDVAVLKELFSIGGASDIIWAFLEDLINRSGGRKDDHRGGAKINFVFCAIFPVYKIPGLVDLRSDCNTSKSLSLPCPIFKIGDDLADSQLMEVT